MLLQLDIHLLHGIPAACHLRRLGEVELTSCLVVCIPPAMEMTAAVISGWHMQWIWGWTMLGTEFRNWSSRMCRVHDGNNDLSR